MIDIHPTSVVDREARLGDGVRIGPNCFVGPRVELGERCRLHNNVTITGNTTIGPDNEFFPTAVIGCIPQDLKYRGGDTRLVIGQANVFRESVTVHLGTEIAGGVTSIGDRNHFLVGCHIAHDVRIGSHCVLSNQVQLAGHVTIEDRVTMGGLIGVHHFVTIGTLAYVGGLSRITTDVPPYAVFAGDPARVRGVNRVGMERWGYSEERVRALRDLFQSLFSRKAMSGGVSVLEKIAAIESDGDATEEVRAVCAFIKRSTFDGVHGRYQESRRNDAREDSRRGTDERAVPAGEEAA